MCRLPFHVAAAPQLLLLGFLASSFATAGCVVYRPAAPQHESFRIERLRSDGDLQLVADLVLPERILSVDSAYLITLSPEGVESRRRAAQIDDRDPDDSLRACLGCFPPGGIRAEDVRGNRVWLPMYALPGGTPVPLDHTLSAVSLVGRDRDGGAVELSAPLPSAGNEWRAGYLGIGGGLDVSTFSRTASRDGVPSAWSPISIRANTRIGAWRSSLAVGRARAVGNEDGDEEFSVDHIALGSGFVIANVDVAATDGPRAALIPELFWLWESEDRSGRERRYEGLMASLSLGVWGIWLPRPGYTRQRDTVMSEIGVFAYRRRGDEEVETVIGVRIGSTGFWWF